MALLGLSCLVSLASAVLLAWLVSDSGGPAAVHEVWSDLQRADDLSGVLMIVTGFAFAAWFRRKHANLPALGARDLRFTPRWASGAFFVPVLNLWRPYQIGVEIWNASDPELSPADPHGWKSLGPPPVIATWWGLFLGVRIAHVTLNTLLVTTSDMLTLILGINAVLELAWGGAAVYTIFLIRELDRRQRVRLELVRRSADAEGMSPEQWLSRIMAPGDRPVGPQCPSCGAQYKLEDYSPKAEHIYCGVCKSELPRDPVT